MPTDEDFDSDPAPNPNPADELAGLHIPVFADRIDEVLGIALDQAGAVLVDGTLGMAGHTLILLERHPGLRVIGIDRDSEALDIARRRVAARNWTDRVRFVHAIYDEVGAVIGRYAPRGVQGVLLDLGVSSLQLDRSERGFAYSVDAPLDMRMDSSTGPTAADVLNSYPAADLTRILRRYGEERFASRIAAAVVKKRATEPFVTSGPLVELIRDAIPAAARRTGGHPAKRTFQALRIEVNGELTALERAMPVAIGGLAVGGRIAVLSYQSLEDRIVKHALAAAAVSTAPPDLPIDLPGHEPELAWLVRGSQQPTDAEIRQNPRAASARLRAAVRVRKAGA